jgi:cell division protein FtsI (penicillin-binding protein 3)/stage V sporulation protein D (sporulation-specific penicillin-binding protein)
MIPTENGYFSYMGHVLRDTHPFRELSVHDIIVHSSNIGAAKLGIQLGDQRLYEYVRKFGFGERTGVQLPGEINGVVHPVYRWDKLSISRIPMGQGVCVTPLQIVTAMSVIANGGSLMMPQIVHDVVGCDGQTVTAFPPVEVRRVISPEVAAQMREALLDVMSKKGTGKDIHVPGFLIAGKTGTAQKVGENGVGYEHGKYIVSFVGFMPADNPQFVCLVMLDDCVVEANKNYGGTIAGPIFAKIAERAARHLGLEPSPELLLEQSKAAAETERAND